MDSPVLVTANYKLSFDALRKELSGINVWILVVDTRGINVWCAAGKGTFSADEIAYQVKRTGLGERVRHRRLILPQLAAPGVAAHTLKKKCGFSGVFGPLRSVDLPFFLENNRVDEAMRTVTFFLPERLVLVPVEIALIWKLFCIVALCFFVLSGIGPDLFSLNAAWDRGVMGIWATLTAILAGALVTPALLPWIPGRQFWVKGMLIGGLAGLLFINGDGNWLEMAGLWLWVTTASSYMAMNFTGATPFTSLSGVKVEMAKGLPFQVVGSFVALVLWLVAPFM